MLENSNTFIIIKSVIQNRMPIYFSSNQTKIFEEALRSLLCKESD